jgi:regulator of sigma E protease
MEITIKIAQFLLSLSILVILHELGHFLFAKLFKTKVEKFYLFFDPWFSLFKYKKGDTEYGIGWLPLGGYVKISGMIDESMDREQLKQPPQPWEFRSKPTWQRLFIMIGGVLVNFILALVIYSMVLFVWGEEYLPTESARYGITCDSLAIKSGLQNGDKIVSIDHKKVEDFFGIIPEIVLDNRKTIQVERNGEIVNVTLADTIIGSLLKKTDFISPRVPFVIGGFEKDSPAPKAGIKEGDRIIKVNDQQTEYFDQFKSAFDKFKQRPLSVSVLRGNDTVNISVSKKGSKLFYIKGDQAIYERKSLKIDTFLRDSTLLRLGFKKGDRLIKLNNTTLKYYYEFRAGVYSFYKKPLELTILRGQKAIVVKITVPSKGLLGVKGTSLDEIFKLKRINYSFLAAIPAGIEKGFSKMADYLKQFRLLFKPKIKAYESLGGFITLTKIFPGEWDWQAFWNLTAFLSIILAIMNILPIPALDGGHVTFLLYEIVTGRKPGEKFLEYAQIVGMILVLALLLYANANDIRKLF